MAVVTWSIDGRAVAAAGQSLLKAARENGFDIPALCHLDGVSEVGACRLCLVEADHTPKSLPACVTIAAEGMVVRARQEKRWAS